MKKYFVNIMLFMLIACDPSSKQSNQNNKLEEKAKLLAKKFIVIDGHVDLPYRMNKKGFTLSKTVEDVSIKTNGNFDYPKAKQGGLDAPFMSVYIPALYQKTGGAKVFADSIIDMVIRIPKVFPKLFALANSPTDIEENFKKGKISLPMGMENGAPIGTDLANVKYFYERGIRYITLTHSKDNQICDSSYDTSYTWNGLSPFGEKVVKEMNKWGIMIDISHITDSAAFDVLKITKTPVIASHSSCRKFTPSWHRNMPDTLIKALAQNNGVIHINFGSSFLSKKVQDNRKKMQEDLINFRIDNHLNEKDSAYIKYAKQYALKNNVYEDIKTVADHIDHVVNLVGIDYVGFGSDYDGVGDSLPKGLKDVSTYPNLILELLKRGYTEKDIEKICYRNTFRVWNEVIKISKKLQG